MVWVFFNSGQGESATRPQGRRMILSKRSLANIRSCAVPASARGITESTGAVKSPLQYVSQTGPNSSGR